MILGLRLVTRTGGRSEAVLARQATNPASPP
jgi:hypothetical protein